MSAPHIILDCLPSLCQNCQIWWKFDVWRSYNKNNFACFFWDTVYSVKVVVLDHLCRLVPE